MYTLKSDLQEVWPVATGRSRDAWAVKETTDGWSTVNPVGYSGILWSGRVGPGIGSLQMPNGADPTYQQWLEQTLKPNLENIKL